MAAQKYTLEEILQKHPEWKDAETFFQVKGYPPTYEGKWHTHYEIFAKRKEKPISADELYMRMSAINEQCAEMFHAFMETYAQDEIPFKTFNSDIKSIMMSILEEEVGIKFGDDAEMFCASIYARMYENDFPTSDELFKDLKDLTIKYYDSLGKKLSKRNFDSIEWWKQHFYPTGVNVITTDGPVSLPEVWVYYNSGSPLRDRYAPLKL